MVLFPGIGQVFRYCLKRSLVINAKQIVKYLFSLSLNVISLNVRIRNMLFSMVSTWS